MPRRVIVGSVRIDNVDDHFDVYAYLRDTSVPLQRPLFNILRDHYDDKLTAAALVDCGDNQYELVIWHAGVEMRFKAGVPRDCADIDPQLFKDHCQTTLQ